jgi:hypothetical protein
MIFAFPFEGGAQLGDAMVESSHADADTDGRALSDAINHAYWQDFATRRDRLGRVAANKKLEALARRHQDIAIVDRMDYVCTPARERCDVIDDRLGKYLYDYGHYTAAGARFYGGRLDTLDWLDPIVGRRPAN